MKNHRALFIAVATWVFLALCVYFVSLIYPQTGCDMFGNVVGFGSLNNDPSYCPAVDAIIFFVIILPLGLVAELFTPANRGPGLQEGLIVAGLFFLAFALIGYLVDRHRVRNRKNS
jgi:hypothetical protein